jgi:hypothetical protein
MTPDLQKKLYEIFEKISSDTDKYPSCWKYCVMDLQEISNSIDTSFDKNAREGFNYLGQVVYTTVCDKCHDEKAFIWLKQFAKAWLDSTELPKFPTLCFFSEGIYDKQNEESPKEGI